MLEQRRNSFLDLLGLTVLAPGFRGVARTTPGPFRGLRRQLLAKVGDHVQHGPGDLLEDMELADLMRHAREDLGERLRVQRRGVRGDAAHRAAPGCKGLPELAEKAADVRVGGVVVEYLEQQPALPGTVHGRQHAEGAVVQLVDGQVAGEVGQSPVQVVGLILLPRLFFPRPRPSFGSWRKGRRRGGHARGARKRPGRAGRLPRRDVRPRR